MLIVIGIIATGNRKENCESQRAKSFLTINMPLPERARRRGSLNLRLSALQLDQSAGKRK
jgi:hypothetical protein